MDIKATAPAPAGQPPGVRSPVRKIRVVIADDEFHVRQVVAGIVRALGAEVVAEAGDGDEAVEAFERLRPDLVILDINMPRMRGDEALTRILAIDPQVVAIMMTAQDTIDSVQECLDRGARHYILKSNRAEEIMRLMTEVWPDCIAHVRSTESK
ncbi:MAG TPA: response regulator transcription factor [Usitatibacter sp.]